MPVSTLNFTVRLADDEADLRDACAVRAAAYGHHLPALAEALRRPDALDHDADVALLLCREKAGGRAIGTARIQCARGASLPIEDALPLPAWLAGQPLAEITRLAVLAEADALTRLMLMKASYLYCLANQVRWLVIGARSDALVRIYRRLGFRDVLEGGHAVPLAHAGGLPHHVLAFDVVAAERTWLAAGHGLYPFMIETFHPDLQLFARRTPAPAPARLPRRRALPSRPWRASAAAPARALRL